MFRSYDLSKFQQELDEATQADRRLRPNDPETDSYIARHEMDSELITQKVDSLPYPKIAVITSGEHEGLYVYSLKTKECFYYEIETERQLRLKNESEAAESSRKYERTRKRQIIIAYCLLLTLGWLGAHKFYVGKSRRALFYILLTLVSLFTLGVPLLLLIPLLFMDLFKVADDVDY